MTNGYSTEHPAQQRDAFFWPDRFLPAAAMLSILFFSSCGNSNNEEQTYLNKQLDTLYVPSIKLQKKEHKAFDPEELKKNKASVFIFLSPDCPLCKAYVPAIKEMMAKFKADSILFYGVFPGTLYSDEEVDGFFKEQDLEMPFFMDDNYLLTDFMKATITPEVFVMDREGHLQYSGRIDNWAYDIGKKRAKITEHELSDALEAMNNGKKIKVKTTSAVGCVIEKKKK